MEIDARGIDALARMAKELGRPEGARRISDATLEAARTVAATAKSIAPARSGRLRSTIRASRKKANARVSSGPPRAVYAAMIHFGSRRRNITPNKFLFRAADRHVQETETLVLAAMAATWEDLV